MQNNKIIRASIWYTVSGFLLKGIGFITTPIFSRILTLEEYGILNNFNSWVAILAIVCTLSLSASLVRARFDYKNDLNSFIKTNLLLGSFVTLIIFGVIFINIDFWSDLFAIDSKYQIIMLLTILANPAYDMFIQVQQFKYKYKTVAALSVILTLSNVGLSLLLIFLFEDNLYARIIGGQLPVILIGFGLYGYFVLSGKKVCFNYLKYSIPMSIPYMIHLLAGVLLNSSDRVMITKICGAGENALYSMAYNIAMIVNMIWTAMNTAYSPWLGERLNEKKYEAIRKYSYGYIGIFIFLVIGVMLVAPEALWILGGEEYVYAKYVIPPVMMGNLFIFMYSLYVNIEQFERKTVGMAVGTVVCSLLNISLNWIFLPKFGYIAGAYTTLISYFFLFVIHYGIVRKIGLNICYNSKYIFVVCIVSVAISGCAVILYEYNIIRYLVICLYTVFSVLVIIFNRHKIINMLKGKVNDDEKSKKIN